MSSNWSCVEFPAVFHQVFHLRHSIIWLNAALIVNHRKRERDDGSNIKWHFPSSSTASCSAVRLLSFQFSRGPDSSLSLLCRRETLKFSGSLYTPVVIKKLNFHFSITIKTHKKIPSEKKWRRQSNNFISFSGILSARITSISIVRVRHDERWEPLTFYTHAVFCIVLIVWSIASGII